MKYVDTDDGPELYEDKWSCIYCTEEVPALCMLYGLAHIVGVSAPTMAMLIRWARNTLLMHTST